MSRSKLEAYGDRWWPALRADLRDRLHGKRGRANARRGYLLAPRGEGKVIWFKAGSSAESVLLACELLGALRERRIDVRLALTFERDYAEVIEPRVRGLRKIGLGYGPGDRPHAVARVMQRLSPLALVLVDTEPYPNLLRAASEAGTHIACVDTLPPRSPVEAAYPSSREQARAWRASGRADCLAEPADPLALFVEAQVDTTLRSLVATGQDGLKLWWWHGPVEAQPGFVHTWRTSALARDSILFVSGDPGVADDVGDLRISAWQRTPLPPGSVVAVDDLRWTAAIASAADAGHLEVAGRRIAWQALAGNSAMSFGAGGASVLKGEGVFEVDGSEAVLRDWQALAAAPLEARRRGDAGRRRFWDERRRAQGVMDEFLQRAFDW